MTTAIATAAPSPDDEGHEYKQDPKEKFIENVFAGDTTYSMADQELFYMELNRRGYMVNNLGFSRQSYMEMFADKRRNIEEDCGYPLTSELNAKKYKDVFDRDPIGYRVDTLYPRACWEVCPDVYETEDINVDTPFEQAFKEVSRAISGVGYYESNEGNPLWEYLERADIASGIGRYGIVLIGTDHGQKLSDPVKLEDLEAAASLIEGKSKDGKKRTYTTIEYKKPKPSVQPSGAPSADKKGKPGTTESVEDDPEETGTGPAKKAPVDKGPSGSGGQYDDSEDREALDTAEDSEGDELDYNPEEFTPKHKLLYLRVLDETLCQISQWGSDPKSTRFGLPEMYTITISGGGYVNPDSGATSGEMAVESTDSTITHQVHWTRVLHLADNLLVNESLGTPRKQKSYNRLYDLHKLYGGSAEMYYQGAMPGLSFETHPELGAEVSMDPEKFKKMVQQYMTRLQRYMYAPGLTVKSLAPQVVDPKPQVEVQLDAICIGEECPKRIFLGSERGELASSQDSRAWVGRVKRRQNRYVSPRIIVAFIDRLIRMGILPVPKQFYCEWPDIAGATDTEKADIGLKRTQAYAAYVSGGVDAIIELKDWLMREMYYSQEEAEQIIEARLEHQEREDAGILGEDLNVHAREDKAAEEEAARMDEEFAKGKQDGDVSIEEAEKDRELQIKLAKMKPKPGGVK